MPGRDGIVSPGRGIHTASIGCESPYSGRLKKYCEYLGGDIETGVVPSPAHDRYFASKVWNEGTDVQYGLIVTEQPRVSSWNILATSNLGNVNQLLAAMLENTPEISMKTDTKTCSSKG